MINNKINNLPKIHKNSKIVRFNNNNIYSNIIKFMANDINKLILNNNSNSN